MSGNRIAARLRGWPGRLILAVSLALPIEVQADLDFAMSTALSGPAAALGQGVKAGVEAAFAEVNAAGGIRGHKLRLEARDDRYEPTEAAPNMHAFADDKRFLAVIGNVGTPTAIVSVPIANQAGLPLVGAFTGAGVLRKSPPDRYIFNYRASYAEETAAMIEGLLQAGIQPQEIAFFTQDDGYGNAGFQGAIAALKARGFDQTETLIHGRYERNTLNVEMAAEMVLEASIVPRAIILVGAYAPCAEFIQLIKDEAPQIRFLNVSFVGSTALKNALGPQAEGVVITQVVPHPLAELDGAAAYRSALAAVDGLATPDFVSLEGYLAARMLIQGLQQIEGEFTRESLVAALESLNDFDLGTGQAARLHGDEHQASHTVWPTIIRQQAFQPLDWNTLL